MKKFIAVALVLIASSAQAEVSTVKVCDGKTLAASNANTYSLGNGVADCTYVDISDAKYFSYQLSCTDAGDSAVSVSVDWVGGSADSTTYMGIPTGMSQLRSAWTTETTYTPIQSIKPPPSPYGSIRLTNGETDADVTCTVLLNIGN